MAQTDYYGTGNLELTYLEIGIALTSIDRMNPGSIPFSIPVLTPNENKESVTNKKIIQRSKTNILNENKDAVDVSNIELSNAIYITIPKELVALPGATYYVNGTFDYLNGSSGSIDISGRLAGGGTVIQGGSFDVQGTVDGNITSYSLLNGSVKGTLSLVLTEEYRYIPKNSKWLIAFVGGDTSMPRVVCRLPD